MYTLVRAYGVERTMNSLWKEQDITTLKLYEIYQLYRELYLEFTNDLIQGPIYCNIKDLEDLMINSDLTLSEFLTANPDTPLVSVAKIPVFETKSVRYMDAFMADYKLELTAPGHKPDSKASQVSKTEVAIHRSGTSTKDLHEYTLITVNGFLHQTDYDKDYTYVLDAGYSLQKSRMNTLGITSFERIGKVHKHQMAISDFLKVDNDTLLSSHVMIKVPEALQGMQIMFSIGGYLVYNDGVSFKRVSDDLYIVDMARLDIPARYFESRKYINYDKLELTSFPKDEDKISLAELLSDEVMIKYLTLPQTFIIGIEAKSLSFVKHYVRHSPIANQYITYSNPVAPLFLGRGRQADYWKLQEEGQFSITVENGYRPRLVNDTVDTNSHPTDSGSNTPYRVYDNSRAYLLDILSDVEKI